MNAKEYLQQIRVLNAKADAIDMELHELREETALLRSSWPDGQPHGKGGKSDPVGNEAAALADQERKLEREYLLLLFQIRAKRYEIIMLLDKIQNAECHDLLTQRYVRAERWEQIAINMGYSYQWVAGPLHNKALQMVDQILKNTNT